MINRLSIIIIKQNNPLLNIDKIQQKDLEQKKKSAGNQFDIYLAICTALTKGLTSSRLVHNG